MAANRRRPTARALSPSTTSTIRSAAASCMTTVHRRPWCEDACHGTAPRPATRATDGHHVGVRVACPQRACLASHVTHPDVDATATRPRAGSCRRPSDRQREGRRCRPETTGCVSGADRVHARQVRRDRRRPWLPDRLTPERRRAARLARSHGVIVIRRQPIVPAALTPCCCTTFPFRLHHPPRHHQHDGGDARQRQLLTRS